MEKDDLKKDEKLAQEDLICPECQGKVEIKDKKPICQVCGAELDESQFWLE